MLRVLASFLFSFKQQHCKVGHLLCRSRSPDFLLDILNRQGQSSSAAAGSSSSSSMPWLADLVESSEGSLGVLPVQCLCEFLLSCQGEKEGGERQRGPKDDGGGEDAVAAAAKRRKERQLLTHLQVSCQILL